MSCMCAERNEEGWLDGRVSMLLYLYQMMTLV